MGRRELLGRLLWSVMLLAGLAAGALAGGPVAAAPATQAATGDLAYVRDGNIWVRTLATGKEHAVTTDGLSSHPAWEPNGQWLAYVSFASSKGVIYLVNADGSRRQPFPTGQADATLPTYSRFGELHWVSRHDQQLDLMYAGTDGPELITTVPGGLCSPTDLSVGPDNDLLLSLSCGRGKNVLHLRPRFNTEEIDVAEKYLTSGLGCAYGATWAPTGSRIAALSSQNCDASTQGSLSIIDVPPVGRPGPSILTGKDIGWVSWSPDEKTLAVTQYPAGFDHGTIVALDVTSGATRPLVPIGNEPAWRPIVTNDGPELPPTPGTPPGMPTTGAPGTGWLLALLLAAACLGLGTGLRRARAR